MSGCDRHAIIPAKTKFIDNIWFGANLHKVDGILVYKNHPYSKVNWSAEGTPKVSTVPPFGVEVGGRIFNPEDFLFKNFSQSGAHDNRRSNDETDTEATINENLQPILTLVDNSLNTRVSCSYTKDKMLKSIFIWIEHPGKKINPDQKVITIITQKGKVFLPANYRTLVKTLGEPLEHIPQHMYNVDHPPER